MLITKRIVNVGEQIVCCFNLVEVGVPGSVIMITQTQSITLAWR